MNPNQQQQQQQQQQGQGGPAPGMHPQAAQAQLPQPLAPGQHTPGGANQPGSAPAPGLDANALATIQSAIQGAVNDPVRMQNLLSGLAASNRINPTQLAQIQAMIARNSQNANLIAQRPALSVQQQQQQQGLAPPPQVMAPPQQAPQSSNAAVALQSAAAPQSVATPPTPAARLAQIESELGPEPSRDASKVMNTSVVRAAQSSSHRSGARPPTMPAMTTFRRPVDAPQGWSLTPARMLEAADLSLDWRSQGRPELHSRARAIHQIRCIEEQSPHGPFLRTLEVTSTKMPAELFHEVLLVQNLIFHWTEEEDALAKGVWPQDSPEEIEEPMNTSVGARAVASPTAESMQALSPSYAQSPPLAGPPTVGCGSLSPELSRPAVEAPALAGPSPKVKITLRRAGPKSTACEEEPISSGRGQKSKDPKPSAVPSYGFAPTLTRAVPKIPNYGITPPLTTNNNPRTTPFRTHRHIVVNPRASKKPRLILADEGPRDDSTSSDAPSSGRSKGDERRCPETVLMLSDSDSEEIPGRTGTAEPSVCSDSEEPQT